MNAKKIGAWVLVALALFAGLALFIRAVSIEDRADCLQWQEEAQQFPHYYIAKWQEEQCAYYHIDVWQYVD